MFASSHTPLLVPVAAVWYTCFACRGSTLERPCNGTVGHYRAHGLCYHQKNKKRLAGRSSSLC